MFGDVSITLLAGVGKVQLAPAAQLRYTLVVGIDGMPEELLNNVLNIPPDVELRILLGGKSYV